MRLPPALRNCLGCGRDDGFVYHRDRAEHICGWCEFFIPEYVIRIAAVNKSSDVELLEAARESYRSRFLSCVVSYRGTMLKLQTTNRLQLRISMHRNHHKVVMELWSSLVRSLERHEAATDDFIRHAFHRGTLGL